MEASQCAHHTRASSASHLVWLQERQAQPLHQSLFSMSPLHRWTTCYMVQRNRYQAHLFNISHLFPHALQMFCKQDPVNSYCPRDGPESFKPWRSREMLRLGFHPSTPSIWELKALPPKTLIGWGAPEEWHTGVGCSKSLHTVELGSQIHYLSSLFMLWIKVATKPVTDDSHRILNQERLPTPIKRE